MLGREAASPPLERGAPPPVPWRSTAPPGPGGGFPPLEKGGPRGDFGTRRRVAGKRPHPRRRACGRTRIDHWVKEDPQVPAYLRFVDDFILLSDSRGVLERWRGAVEERLGSLRLRLHRRKSVIRRTDEGMPFLGYVVWPGRIRIRGETVRRYRRKLRARPRGTASRQEGRRLSLAAWRGHVELAGSFRRVGSLK